ncbi:hypothetical protein GCM10027592_40260 [Spirosoma flavus]
MDLAEAILLVLYAKLPAQFLILSSGIQLTNGASTGAAKSDEYSFINVLFCMIIGFFAKLIG